MILSNATAILHDAATESSGDLILDGAVVAEPGTEPAGETLDVSGCVVTPGLVNAHHHLMQSAFRTLPGTRGVPMAEWLPTMAAAYSRVGISPELMRAAASVGVAEGLLFGVTTVADHHLSWPAGLPAGASVALARATAEAAREGTSVYGRTREAAGYDFAERSGKLDAQREIGPDGVRSNAQIGEQRRQADNAGFAEGAAAAGVSVREAARLDSFIRALAGTAGNQVDMAEGGAEGIADRARNERLTGIVEKERLTRTQALLRAHGVEMSKRQIAMDQNGDLSLNLTPELAAQMWGGGLINESQLGAIANGGHARFSFAHNDLLVSSSTGFSQSARNDTSTRFEAGKQAGPDTIEHFLGSGPEGQAAMANWLRGGFEMDRRGNWRLKPQVADTLERDVTAIIAQTGWQRSLSRSAEHSTVDSQSLSGHITASASRSAGGAEDKDGKAGKSSSITGTAAASLGVEITDRGGFSVAAQSSMDIVNYDVREAIAGAERTAAKSARPEETFARELSQRVLGNNGLRNRYLEQADSGRGTVDVTGPITSLEQSSILRSGRLMSDRDDGWADGDSSFKSRRDK